MYAVRKLGVVWFLYTFPQILQSTSCSSTDTAEYDLLLASSRNAVLCLEENELNAVGKYTCMMLEVDVDLTVMDTRQIDSWVACICKLNRFATQDPQLNVLGHKI